jgi:hypothetical protein
MGPGFFCSVAGGCLRSWNFLNSNNRNVMLSHRFRDFILWNSCSHFYFFPPPVRLLYLGRYRDRKEKNLNEISPLVLGLVKAWKCGFMGIVGPISSAPWCLYVCRPLFCMYVGPYSRTTHGLRLYTYTFLNQKFRSVGLGFRV